MSPLPAQKLSEEHSQESDSQLAELIESLKRIRSDLLQHHTLLIMEVRQELARGIDQLKLLSSQLHGIAEGQDPSDKQ